MIIEHTRTPVVVLGCNIGALAIARSLSPFGIHVYAVEGNSKAPALSSRHFRRNFIVPFTPPHSDQYLQALLSISGKAGYPALLIPTSDELAEWVAKHQAILRRYFLFQDNPYDFVKSLASKKNMYQLAVDNDIPTAITKFPQSESEARQISKTIQFPAMLKGIYGNRLQERTGYKMAIVHSKKELMDLYRLLDEPGYPNLMIQELIPGGDDQVYIFNGYFDRNADCLAAFTGYKVRQCPIHVGCASLGECRWNQTVADLTTRFMKQIGYQGILDIGYRLDPRDGQYKVLDINPRVGQAFRIFVGHKGMDVVRAMYLDLTGQKVPVDKPIEGRRWIIENYDFIHSVPFYFTEKSIGVREWLVSFRGLQEGAWFASDDPLPFIRLMMEDYTYGFFRWLFLKLPPRAFNSLRRKLFT